MTCNLKNSLIIINRNVGWFCSNLQVWIKIKFNYWRRFEIKRVIRWRNWLGTDIRSLFMCFYLWGYWENRKMTIAGHSERPWTTITPTNLHLDVIILKAEINESLQNYKNERKCQSRYALFLLFIHMLIYLSHRLVILQHWKESSEPSRWGGCFNLTNSIKRIWE